MIAKATPVRCGKLLANCQLEKKKTFPNQIVANNKMIDDPQKFVKLLMFTLQQLGKNIGKNIKSHESTHSLGPNFSNSFFFSPATAEEIYKLIGNIKI